MRILIDTNIIIRLAQPHNPLRPEIVTALQMLNAASHELCVVPQIFYEYWVVATRPVENNGLGMVTAVVKQSVLLLLQDFVLIGDVSGLFEQWLDLVSVHDVKGRNAHDARLAAAMKQHAVPRLLTYNSADFKRYLFVDAVSPAEIVAG